MNGQQEQIDVLDISSPSTPTKIGSIELSGRPNSAAVANGILAVAIHADPATEPGLAMFYSSSCDPSPTGDCAALEEIPVGAFPTC